MDFTIRLTSRSEYRIPRHIDFERGAMQKVVAEIEGAYRFLELPDADEWLMPGVRWGSFEHALSPAFWVSQSWMMMGNPSSSSFQLGRSLIDEVVICLLCGHGMPAEVGLAAADRIIEALRAQSGHTLPRQTIEALLLEPLIVRGRPTRYRFARRRAEYLAESLHGLTTIHEERLGDVELRDALNDLPGIGPKTASWIVRNRRASDDVAILDVHIVHACKIMGVFSENADPGRQYAKLEEQFLKFCTNSLSRASAIDATMWAVMRNLSKQALHFLIDPIRST